MRAVRGAKSDTLFLRGWAGADWIYPMPRLSQAEAALAANVAHATSGLENGLSVASGGAIMRFLDGVYCVQLSNGANDQAQTIALAAQAQLAKLPVNVQLEEHRRIHWYSMRVRVLSPGTTRFFGLVGLLPNQVGVGFPASNTSPIDREFIGLTLDGAGGWQFMRKEGIDITAPDEELPLVWPRPLNQWTEVWFVILGATATLPARFRLYVNQELRVERAWPDDGLTGSGNPTLDAGATAFYWGARANGLAQAGLQIYIAGWRYRQGFYDVDGSELTGL